MDNVWFLFGSLGTDPVERSCVIPADRAIFIPILNQFFGGVLE